MLLTLAATPAWALSEPTPSTKDAHVRTVAYDPQNRVQLVIQEGGVTNISFDTMEFIQHSVRADGAPFGYPAVGKDQGGDGPVSNNLPLVGLKSGAGSLVVITRHAPPNDVERVYNFAVRVVPAPSGGGDDPAVTYQLTFTYGAEFRSAPPRETTAMMASTAAPVARAMTWKEKKAAKDAEIMQARLRADATFGPQNLAYIAKGRDSAIAPVAAFDNGNLTAFRYPGNMNQPAVFRVLDTLQGPPAICSGGKPSRDELEAAEQQQNTTVTNDLLVVHETAPHWRLRNGEQVIDIWNCAYDPIGHNPGTGTLSPNVARRVILP